MRIRFSPPSIETLTLDVIPSIFLSDTVFRYASVFVRDLSSWDVSRAITMTKSMFVDRGRASEIVLDRFIHDFSFLALFVFVNSDGRQPYSVYHHVWQILGEERHFPT